MCLSLSFGMEDCKNYYIELGVMCVIIKRLHTLVTLLRRAIALLVG